MNFVFRNIVDQTKTHIRFWSPNISMADVSLNPTHWHCWTNNVQPAISKNILEYATWTFGWF